MVAASEGLFSTPSRMPASVSLVHLLGSPPDDKGAPTSLTCRLVTIEPRTHLDLDLERKGQDHHLLTEGAPSALVQIGHD